MTDDLPESILARAQRLTGLFQAHPTAELGEALHLMTEMLHIAVHGDTWARPESPAEVWLGLLAEVRERHPRPSMATPPMQIHVTSTPGTPAAMDRIRDEYIRQARRQPSRWW